MEGSPNFEDKEFELFLEAFQENQTIGPDVEELKGEIEVFKNRLQRVTKRLKDSLGTQAKQATAIEKLNKERIRLKQQLIETSFQRKNAEFQLHNTAADAQSLKHELKAKGDMLLALEKERRRLEVDLQKNERTGSRSNLSSAATAIVRPRPRSVSADRLRDKRTQYGKQLLLQSGLTNAYVASKVANVDADDEEAELEKVVMLQKLLLGKSKQVIERDVKIEELQKRSQELIQQLHRLRRARQFAEELTVTRHKLNIRTNQVEGMKGEILKLKTEVTALRGEMERLREKLRETYNEKLYFG